MIYAPIVQEVFAALWWFVPAVLVIWIFKSSSFKGYIGELFIRLSAKLMLKKEVYHPIHNVTFPTEGGTTQIDHIFTSRFGIFVVETKNMKGWIFGSEKQGNWTQKIYKQSFKFQNPLRQNYKHVKSLATGLQIPLANIHSVVVFVGGSTFKTDMPPNVTYAGGYIRYIKSKQEQLFSVEEVEKIISKINSLRLKPTMATHRAHVKHVQSRRNPDSSRKCPECGRSMVLRTTKRGARAGQQFWGCSGYPRCRVTQDLA